MARRETMTSEERVWAATRLEKPDRVPIDILAGAAHATATGWTVADWYINMSEDQQWAAIDKVWDYTGGWDMDLTSIAMGNPMGVRVLITAAMGVRMKFPGVDLPDNYTTQAFEQEVMTLKDYDTIAEIGWQRFMDEDY